MEESQGARMPFHSAANATVGRLIKLVLAHQHFADNRLDVTEHSSLRKLSAKLARTYFFNFIIAYFSRLLLSFEKFLWNFFKIIIIYRKSGRKIPTLFQKSLDKRG